MSSYIFRGVSKIAERNISFVMYVRPSVRPSFLPYGTFRLQLEGFFL